MEEGKSRYFCYVVNCIQSGLGWIFQLLQCIISRRRTTTFPLGFFLQPDLQICADPSSFGLSSPPSVQFLSTSKGGKDLKKRKRGAMDASLSFLNQNVYIAASSNGFLLCISEQYEQMQYFICNPITKEWRILPKPHKAYEDQALAFICKGSHTSLDRAHYKVIRAGVSNPKALTTTLEIETFSSLTGEWKPSTLVCASPFLLVVANIPAFVVDEVIHWRDMQCCMVAYDPVKEFVELIELPGDAQNFVYWSDLLGQSAGKVHYARHDKRHLEVWVLKNYKKGKWILKHKVSLETMIRENLRIDSGMINYDSVGIEAFHPWDSQHILLELHRRRFWYHIESKKLSRIRNRCYRSPCRYFLYEWPSASH